MAFIYPEQVEENVWDLAKERVRKIYDLVDHVVVAFSGGKDSMAVLEVTLEVTKELGKTPLHVYHIDEELLSPDTVDYLNRTRQRKDIKMDWWCIPTRFTNVCSFECPQVVMWDEKEKENWFREMPEWALTKEDLPIQLDEYYNGDIDCIMYPPERYGTVACLLGIRADESLRRRTNVSSREHDNYIKHKKGKYCKGNVYKAFPVYDWLVDDIWTGAKLFGWDYNKQYDKFYKLNITPRNQRVAPFIGDGLANIKILKEAYPELWGKLVKRVPGSASGMRYADTNLYARGGVIEKPDNYTWMEWIKEYLSRYPPEYREKMVKTVKTRLKYHYKNTGEPLPEDGSKHPVSEESWKDLMVLVMLQNNFGRRGRVILKKTGDELWYQKKMKRKQTINKTK